MIVFCEECGKRYQIVLSKCSGRRLCFTCEQCQIPIEIPASVIQEKKDAENSCFESDAA